MDSEVIALRVEQEILAEQGLTFERSDYINRFMGSDRLRAVMMAELIEVPGAGKAIAGLTLPKAIASSGSVGGLERKLKRTGLWDHFAPHVYGADHVTNAKPAPDLFLHAAAALGVTPGDCLVLEDSVNGVIGAKAAGMTVWGFLGGGHADDGLGTRLVQVGAERLVKDWPEAARLLAGT